MGRGSRRDDAYVVPLALSASSSPYPNHPRIFVWYRLLQTGFQACQRGYPGCLARNRRGVVGDWVPIATSHGSTFRHSSRRQEPVSGAKECPFLSLRRQGVIQDVKNDGDVEVNRGIAIHGAYHPISSVGACHRLYCLSLPFLLGQHPFVKGRMSSTEMAQVVADAIREEERNSPVPMMGPSMREAVATADLPLQAGI
jgi:hypothetical protein